MARLEDVRRAAMSLPEVAESDGERLGWSVRGKMIAWQRALRPNDVRDLEALGQTVPSGEIVALRTQGQPGKEELLASGVPGVFTIPHFNRYPGLLVALDQIEADELAELVTDAWLAQAPKRLAREFLAGTPGHG